MLFGKECVLCNIEPIRQKTTKARNKNNTPVGDFEKLKIILVDT